jgi:hypothetical protein
MMMFPSLLFTDIHDTVVVDAYIKNGPVDHYVVKKVGQDLTVLYTGSSQY